MNIGISIVRDLRRMESEFIGSTVNGSAFDSSIANKHNETSNSDHRFSFGHYDAMFQRSADLDMGLALGHRHSIGDRFAESPRQPHKATSQKKSVTKRT